MNKSTHFDMSYVLYRRFKSRREKDSFSQFDPLASPLSSSLTELSDLLKHYSLSEMRSTAPLLYDCDWNGKMMAENSKENYHVQGLHRETVNSVLPARNDITEDLDGQYAVVHLPADIR